MESKEKLIEQVLILRCQLGDRDAFAELIEKYQAQLRYFINRLLIDSTMTEDIFQETWLAAIRKIHNLKKVEAFPTWLYCIARNNVYRQLKKNKQLSTLVKNVTVVDHVEDDISFSCDAATIHRCLGELQPEHKEILMLRFLGQMSYQQISEVLNCNLGTVKSRIYYARRALKQKMEV